MPGMSPRIKAKKGRFGVAGLPPSINITFPNNGYVADPNTGFTATAVATDPESGDLTSLITWSTAIISSTGTIILGATTGGSTVITFPGGSPGVSSGDIFTVTATIVDGGFNVTDTINITIV